ncbi:Bifunctional adenosylcobalamin biosynthesis protein CobP [Acaryochloris thomasi RCC1774]|uniref:Adenosylcobinamide kinase n=1 Tax=Acaryochloris thomasi RCC1774 TaxID=1764569 RepID=A0A2W1JQN5_9CYAN|nr:Bifunctional adenosylcobalamin biosynthesis protein CobP [Acaryochloris thomasi RCC1774]
MVYVATSSGNDQDAEWQRRLRSHQIRRPQTWKTLEIPIALPTALDQATLGTCLLIDSLGTWLANVLEQENEHWQQTSEALIYSLNHSPATVILVAEETGWGVIPAYPSGRLFRDRLGTLVRQIGNIADAVYLVGAGYALNLKVLGTPVPASDAL